MVDPVMEAVDLTPWLGRPDPIQRLEINGQVCWLKQASAPHSAWRYRALDLFARRLNIALLQPVPNPGGTESIAIEKRRLIQLRELGLRVPDVLCHGESFLLLSDLGPDLRHRLRATTQAEERLELLQRVLSVLLDLHRQGGFLSQAFPRNITVNDLGQVGFLDFEDDPAAVLTTAQAQARDLLLLAMNVLYFFEDCLQQAALVLHTFLVGWSPAPRAEFVDAVGKLQGIKRWLDQPWFGRRLPRQRAMMTGLNEAVSLL